MKRKFIVGDEWIYFKIYCGPIIAEKVIVQVVKPLTDELLSKSIIDKWFFIRYADPNHHLCIRFHFNNPDSIFFIINEMNKLINPYVDKHIVDSVLIDTYKRELERYGSSCIEITENLFFFDSQMIISFINIFEDDEGEDIRWLFALRAIDAMLVDFGFSESKKLELLHLLKDEFGKEFGFNKALKVQLDRKYRGNRCKILDIFNGTYNNSSISCIESLLKNRFANSKDEIHNLIRREKELERSLFELLTSYIHMMINRLFKSKQRQHELVIYYFLYKYYTSEIAKRKNKSLVQKKVDD